MKIIKIILFLLFINCSLGATIYLEKPAEFNPRFEIAACYLEYQDKILILHRQENKLSSSAQDPLALKRLFRLTKGDMMLCFTKRAILWAEISSRAAYRHLKPLSNDCLRIIKNV